MNQLNGSSILFSKKPEKLIFLLHGYGDNAENFLPLARFLNSNNLDINFFAPNAPTIVPQYSSGRQWFNPYPNGTHYNEAGEAEKITMQNECLESIKLLSDK